VSRIELAGLSVCGPDGRAVVLAGLDLTVADGELLAVVGPGRSALLRALVGLADTPAGTLRIDGEDATDWAPAERDLAVVFQDHAPYPHLRVRDNLALPLRLLGAPGAVVARRVREVADGLGLTVHLDRWPSQLSGVQRQRLAVGRVLVRPTPAAYVLDEPLPDDPGARARLRAAVAGTTTVWATADPGEAAALGDRVAVLRDGRLAQVGTPAELAARPATLDIAVLAPLTVLAGTVEAGTLRLPFGTLPLPHPDGDVLVGIRPADVTETGAGSRFTLLAGDGAAPDGSARLRHPGVARAAEADPRLSPDVLARVDPGPRRTVPVVLDPARLLLFDPGTGERR
jgi:ABC-type sugar transport system ATPase subunit